LRKSGSAKTSLKRLVTHVGRRLTARDTAGRRVVLCYHSIHPSNSFASATPDAFGLHLDWLVAHCDVVALEQIEPAARPTHRPRPAVAITFDDGYVDNYEFAFPLLEQRGLRATFFLTAGFLEKDPRVITRVGMLRRGHHGEVRPLEWAHVRAMHAAGMEIGAHTYSHPNLALLSRPAAYEELRLSKEILEQRVGEPIRSMAYPFGKPARHFTPETVTVARELGYERACAVLFRAVRPSDSELAIPRFFVNSDRVEPLRDKVLGAWDLLGLWQEKAPLWAARLVSPDDFVE
jgi:peptidoglycan/xylan/chitin deacetylase (PgdA/CDA1 family)